MKGKVFSIEEFATFDGPGIRTTVFLKGCPLKCVWCHNPEGQDPNVGFARSFNGCLRCGKCENMAKHTESGMMYTEKSRDVCPLHLIKECGVEYSARELTDKLLKNARILNANGGGVTFSGGEPLAQSEFLSECLDLISKKMNRALQTCGYASEKTFSSVLEKVDYCLFDLKISDSEKHRLYCGTDNVTIKKNYEILVRSGKPFVTRIPLIPGITDTEDNLSEIAEFMRSLSVKYVEVLPYNLSAGAKYASVGKIYTADVDLKNENKNVTEIFSEYKISCKRM